MQECPLLVVPNICINACVRCRVCMYGGQTWYRGVWSALIICRFWVKGSYVRKRHIFESLCSYAHMNLPPANQASPLRTYALAHACMQIFIRCPRVCLCLYVHAHVCGETQPWRFCWHLAGRMHWWLGLRMHVYWCVCIPLITCCIPCMYTHEHQPMQSDVGHRVCVHVRVSMQWSVLNPRRWIIFVYALTSLFMQSASQH